MKYTKKELELIFKMTKRLIDRFEVKALEVAKENDIDENKFNELFEVAFDEVSREFLKDEEERE